MDAWVANIEQETLRNESFRTVLFTGSQLQITVMHLQPGEDIGVERHEGLDQFLRVEDGVATVTLGDARDALSTTHTLHEDWAIVVPSGTWHNVRNGGDRPLKLYSLYAPPEHPPRTLHRTKAEADAAHAAEADAAHAAEHP